MRKGVKLAGVGVQKRLTMLGGAEADSRGGSPHLVVFCSNPAMPLQCPCVFIAGDTGGDVATRAGWKQDAGRAVREFGGFCIGFSTCH